jgi:hypothetical protein
LQQSELRACRTSSATVPAKMGRAEAPTTSPAAPTAISVADLGSYLSRLPGVYVWADVFRVNRVHARSDRRHGHNDGDRNSGSNRRIFNGCCARGVFQKPSKHSHLPAVRRHYIPAGYGFFKPIAQIRIENKPLAGRGGSHGDGEAFRGHDVGEPCRRD